jgi:hypothetical protein
MPEPRQHIDLDDTAGCPLGRRCESCGTEAGPLAVETGSAARLGVLCMTLCRRCAAYDDQRNGGRSVSPSRHASGQTPRCGSRSQAATCRSCCVSDAS